MRTYCDGIYAVQQVADELGTNAHNHFLVSWSPLNKKSVDYWQGRADACADIVEVCEALKEEHGTLARMALRLVRNTRIRLGL